MNVARKGGRKLVFGWEKSQEVQQTDGNNISKENLIMTESKV